MENGALTDACFPFFSAMPKLRYLLLDGNAGINGNGLSALQGCKLDLLTLNRTGLDGAGLLQDVYKRQASSSASATGMRWNTPRRCRCSPIC